MVLAVGAAPAQARDVLSGVVSTAQAQQRVCHEHLADAGAAGIVQRKVTAPATGVISARLTGRPGGDWDLGVFAKDGRSVAGSAYFGNRELAEGIALKGEKLTVQACRLSGPVDSADLEVDGWALPSAEGADRVRMVRVSTPTPADKDALVNTGLDLTEHAEATSIDVVLHGDDDLNVLETAGFDFDVIIPDLVRHDRAALRLAEQQAKREGDDPSAPILPSGRTNYRRLPDYYADMKKLVRKYPSLVRPITLPYLTHRGRPVQGVEITHHPNRRDGKPVFVQLGVHHAREWPSGEMAMEWAFELTNNYGTDPRATQLLDNARTIVVPIVNPDGFNLTREVPFANEELDPTASEIPIDGGQPVVDPGFGYKRRNCRMIELNKQKSDYERAKGECSQPRNRNLGVDPNRNYGALWGGPGASPDPTNDTFWGPKPFSEPESRNVRWLVSHNQATTLITNHTFSDLILRPPGVASQGDVIDEDDYRALGASMAASNGYSNWKGFQLYDTTGTTEDWTYNATGGYGFTFEIGRAAQSLTNDVGTGEPTSDLVIDIAGSYAGVGFHPPYPLGVIGEWYGQGPWFGQGNKEAYYTAFESTVNTERHSVITGRARPGTVLTLSKTFQTHTSPQSPNNHGLPIYDPDGQPRRFTDHLETKMVVPRSGNFEWHVNPSTRPRVLQGRPGRNPTGPTSETQTFKHDPDAPFFPGGGAPAPGTYEERDFTIPKRDDNGRLDLHLEWPAGENPSGPEDLDLRLYRANELGVYEEIASSTNSGGPEDLSVVDPPPGDYRIRVENWFAISEKSKDWRATLSFAPPTEPQPGTHEAWSLRCKAPNGDKDTDSIVVDRGELKVADLDGCGRDGARRLKAGELPEPKAE